MKYAVLKSWKGEADLKIMYKDLAVVFRRKHCIYLIIAGKTCSRTVRLHWKPIQRAWAKWQFKLNRVLSCLPLPNKGLYITVFKIQHIHFLHILFFRDCYGCQKNMFIFLYGLNVFVFVTELVYVYCTVEIECLNIMKGIITLQLPCCVCGGYLLAF